MKLPLPALTALAAALAVALACAGGVLAQSPGETPPPSEPPPSETPPPEPQPEPPPEECPAEQSRGNGTFVGMVSEQLFASTDPVFRRCSLNKHADAGVRILRQGLLWREIERRPGEYDWDHWDAYMGAVARHGIQVMPIIFDAPEWRWRAGPRPKWGAIPPRRPAIARFARILVRRYGPDGRFWAQNPDIPAVPVRSWQIWNEPNLARYWARRPDARAYGRMLAATGRAIKREDPEAEVVGAGMPDSRLWRAVGLYEYIHQLYLAGARGTFDALAVNAYAETPKRMLKTIDNVRQVMRAHGDEAGIWITEMGWGTGGPRYRFRTSRSRQAKYLRQSLNLLGRNRRKLGIRGFIHYMWQDAPPYGDTPDFWGLHTGLLDIRGREKPAYGAFRKVAQRLRWIRDEPTPPAR